MKNPEIHIQSYFSIETDLAKEFSCWPDYIEGNGYDVLFCSKDGEKVSTKFIVETEGEHKDQFVKVKGNRNGPLFQRVLGYATYLLAQHSDNLMVHK